MDTEPDEPLHEQVKGLKTKGKTESNIMFITSKMKAPKSNIDVNIYKKYLPHPTWLMVKGNIQVQEQKSTSPPPLPAFS